MRMRCSRWGLPPSGVILKNCVNTIAQAGSPVTQPHPLFHNAIRLRGQTVRGHLDSSHSGSTAKYIIAHTQKPHSQHHLGLIFKYQTELLNDRLSKDMPWYMPKSWVHSYCGNRIRRECALGSSQGRRSTQCRRSLCRSTRCSFNSSLKAGHVTVTCSIVAVIIPANPVNCL